MEAPETIFVMPLGYGCLSEPCTDKMFASQIEYVRKDAFIEKAKNWLYLQLNEINMEGKDMTNFLKDFQKYMEK